MTPIVDWHNFESRSRRGWRGPRAGKASVERWALSYPIAGRRFARCPICGTGGDLTDEHVPPKSVGGRTLTGTCGHCNHNAGSTIDADLQRWVQTSDPFARMELDGVRGARKLRNVALVNNVSDELVVAIAGTGDPDLKAAFTSGSVRGFTLHLHEPQRARLGLRKSVYLACCAVLGEVPRGTVADIVRRDLILAMKGKLVDAGSSSAMQLTMLTCNAPEPQRPRLLVFEDGDEYVVGVAMSYFAVYGQPVIELLRGMNSRPVEIEAMSTPPPRFLAE